jgi:hypothetical protein
LRQALALFQEAYDPANGGFGGAPKFPQPSIPSFVLRAAKRFGDAEAVKMVRHTCEKMAAGGIHDQLGGGFARYSVDAEWLVPHFEKMLYDNAQLVHLYLDAHLLSLGGTGDPPVPSGDSPDGSGAASLSQKMVSPATAPPPVPVGGSPTGAGGSPAPPILQTGSSDESLFAATARDILDYVLREMTHPDGGFYSAEDADSEGHEGKFYCWTYDELSKLLAPDEFAVAARYFGVTQNGNFVDHSHPHPLPGQNVLSIADPLITGSTSNIQRDPSPRPSPLRGEREDGSERFEMANAGEQLIAFAKAKMLAVRTKRIRPQLDDKILASWNGLMLGAFARASAVLGDDKYRIAAGKNLAFIRANLWDEKSKTLGHRWRDGARDNVQLLDSYAFLLDGVIQFYEATLEPAHLDFAVHLAETMLAKFYDEADGGFWQSPAGASDLILRVKDDYDGAEPSGNSVATLALLKLAAITGREDLRRAAETTLQLSAARLRQQPAALAFMLQALDFWLDEPRRVVISGDTNSPRFHELLSAAHSVYQPNKIVLGTIGEVEPFAKTLAAKGGPTVYLCTGNACQPPTNDPSNVKDLLH